MCRRALSHFAHAFTNAEDQSYTSILFLPVGFLERLVGLISYNRLSEKRRSIWIWNSRSARVIRPAALHAINAGCERSVVTASFQSAPIA